MSPRLQGMPAPHGSEDRQRAQLIVTGCGPGELISWVLPLVEALSSSENRLWSVDLVFWPRLFLSGRETVTLARDVRFRLLLRPLAALRLLAGAPLPGAWREDPSPRLLLHMGGAPELSLELARRLDCPADAYLEAPTRRLAGFRRLYAADERALRLLSGHAARGGKALKVGNLIVDAMSELGRRRARPDGLRGSGDGPLIGLFPGSRSFQLRHAVPMLLPIARQVLSSRPECRFAIAQAPFVSHRTLAEAVRRANRRAAPGMPPLSLRESAGECVLSDGGGPELPIMHREMMFESMDLMVSSPGTNTAEAAALGIPMLVVSPFDTAAPLMNGVSGLLERIPLAGPRWRRRLARNLAGDMRYYAYPNIRAEQALVAELSGDLDAGRIAREVVRLVADASALRRTAEGLRDLLGPPGAARRLVYELESRLS